MSMASRNDERDKTMLIEPINGLGCGCDDADMVDPLLSVEAALDKGLSIAHPVSDVETMPVTQALGRVLARPVRAQAHMPPFDNAGMDGYALRSADAEQGWIPVDGEAVAGAAPEALRKGSAMRIYTGAPVPTGADTVVMQEHVVREGGGIRFSKGLHAGENIRRCGEDVKRNDRVLEPGVLLGPREIAACAGAGTGEVTVWRKLKVGLLLTGDELRAPGTPRQEGQIWDVNGPMLTALTGLHHVDLTHVTHSCDSKTTLSTDFERMAGKVDLIVTSGGVSVGERDHIKPALRELGAQIVASGVAIKPGKPVTISRLEKTAVISLPGNPVSALVTWLVLGVPIVSRMAGIVGTRALRRHVRCAQSVGHKPGRCEYRPARIVGFGSDGLEVVETAAATHSAHLAPLCAADGLLLFPSHCDGATPNDLMEFLPFPG